MIMSLALAVVAKLIALGIGLENSIDLLSLATVSIVGGILGSIVVLAAALGLTAGAVRFGGTSTTSTPRWSRRWATC